MRRLQPSHELAASFVAVVATVGRPLDPHKVCPVDHVRGLAVNRRWLLPPIIACYAYAAFSDGIDAYLTAITGLLAVIAVCLVLENP